MPTILNPQRHQASYTEADGTGVIIGVLIIVLAVLLFLVFGAPYLRSHMPPSDFSSFHLPDNSYNFEQRDSRLIPHQPV